MKLNLISMICLLIFIRSAKGAKVLAVFGYHRASQYIFISPLLKAMAERGHKVTSISMFPQKEPLNNFRDISILESSQPFEPFRSEIPNSRSSKYHICEISQHSARLEATMVSNVLDNPRVKTLMLNESFDLIILRIVGAESLFGLGEYFKAPIIAISTLGTSETIDYLVGNTSPPAYVPHAQLPFDNNMSLKQRALTVFMTAARTLCHNFLVVPTQEKLYMKYFPSAKRTFDEARKNVSLVLLNDHFSLSFPRPYVPNMIEVAGIHIQAKPDPLPEELQKILDGATDGVIYFSLGSNVKSKDLTKEILNVFLEVFRELKLTVLWKFENDSLVNQPANVITQKWFPQSPILAHANVKLFITHGGKLSITETVFHGKPILGLPAGLDQPLNVQNAVKAGYALSRPLQEVTKESLKASIEELLTNPRYREAAQLISKRFRDRPISPLQTATYWVEYVLRHKGAVHMRNAGQDLVFWQYHNIDVYGIVAGFFVAFVLVLIGVLHLFKILNRIQGKVKLKIY